MAGSDRYVVISADCHGGAELYQYRDYLERRHHDAFDAWARDYAIPFEDLMGEEGGRNWDHDRRLADQEADGIVAEVVYPNTIPPFYPEPSLKAQVPGATQGDLDLRWAGLRAHNRWLVDFCDAAPGRRAGIAQIMLHDVDAAVAEIEWAAAAGLRGGVLLPGAPPGSGLEPLYSPVYEPIWAACDDAGLVVNHHAGSAVPPLGDQPIDQVTFLLEVTWYAHRALWNLLFGGVMERHPTLQFVFTEQGTAWIPETLMTLDYFFHRMGTAVGSQEYEWGNPVVSALSLRPSEYWARQCHVGSSFMRPAEAVLRHAVGVDRIMWGSDYPHKEASFPFSREALRAAFAGVDSAEVQQMIGGNAGRLYGFDMDLLGRLADRVGPTHDEIARPLTADQVPAEADRCPAFAGLAG
ncbi:MAG TPA: amidohydrolase family protein [Acidimicrobiales bacterium]|nr:amidohydrolase family protein [Acidimicrobiales bacterium]